MLTALFIFYFRSRNFSAMNAWSCFFRAEEIILISQALLIRPTYGTTPGILIIAEPCGQTGRTNYPKGKNRKKTQ